MDKMVEALEKKRGDTPVVEFAEGLGVHFTTYYKWLKGERLIGPRIFKKILMRYPDLTLVFLRQIGSDRPASPTPSPSGE